MGIDSKSHPDEINGGLNAVRKGTLVQQVLLLGFFVSTPLVPNRLPFAR
jgi:hypothetical protein